MPWALGASAPLCMIKSGAKTSRCVALLIGHMMREVDAHGACPACVSLHGCSSTVVEPEAGVSIHYLAALTWASALYAVMQ